MRATDNISGVPRPTLWTTWHYNLVAFGGSSSETLGWRGAVVLRDLAIRSRDPPGRREKDIARAELRNFLDPPHIASYRGWENLGAAIRGPLWNCSDFARLRGDRGIHLHSDRKTGIRRARLGFDCERDSMRGVLYTTEWKGKRMNDDNHRWI